MRLCRSPSRVLGPECSRPLQGRPTNSLWPKICDGRVRFLADHLFRGLLARPFLTADQVEQEALAGGRGPEPESFPGVWVTLSDSQPGVLVSRQLKSGDGSAQHPPIFAVQAQAVRSDGTLGEPVAGPWA